MSARKKAEPTEATAEPAETPKPAPKPSESTDVGGLADLQAKADEDAARGHLGSKEKTA